MIFFLTLVANCIRIADKQHFLITLVSLVFPFPRKEGAKAERERGRSRESVRLLKFSMKYHVYMI